MAHDDLLRQKAKSAYASGQTLESICILVGVPVPTLKKWKYGAKLKGDDWDRARQVNIAMAGNSTDMVKQSLGLLMTMFLSTIESIHADGSITPEKKVQLHASLSDSLAKTSKALMAFSPGEKDRVVQLDVLKKLAEFVKDKYPEHADVFAEVLSPFGEYLVDGQA